VAKKTGKGYGALGIGGLFFSAGYLVTLLVQNTRYADRAATIATTVAVGLTIPLASRARRVLLGALRGLGLGLAAAMGIALALYSPKVAAHPDRLPRRAPPAAAPAPAGMTAPISPGTGSCPRWS